MWSTLSNHIKYDYFEVLKCSSIALVFLGPRHYGIFRKKSPVQQDENLESGVAQSSVRGKKRRTSQTSTQSAKKKTTGRTSGKKGKSTKAPSRLSSSLQESRNKKYGIGSSVDTENYGRGKRSTSKNVNYLKLNEGEDAVDDTPISPKRSRSASHTPGRSGPTPHRQTAQKTVTVSPRVTTISTVKQKKDAQSEPNPDVLIAVQIARTTAVTSTSEIASTTDSNRSSLGVKDAFFGIPELEDSAVFAGFGT